MPLLPFVTAPQSHIVECPGYLCGAEPPTPVAFAMRLDRRSSTPRSRMVSPELTPAATQSCPAGEKKKFPRPVSKVLRLQGDRSPARARPTWSLVVRQPQPPSDLHGWFCARGLVYPRVGGGCTTAPPRSSSSPRIFLPPIFGLVIPSSTAE